MKILLLNDVFPEERDRESVSEPRGGGGGPTIVHSLAQGYSLRGHSVHVLTTHQGDPQTIIRRQTESYIITSLPIPHSPKILQGYLTLWNPKVSALLKAFLQQEGPFDAAHAHFIQQFLTYRSLALTKKHTKKLIITFHDVMSVAYGRITTKAYLNHGDARLRIKDHIAQGWRAYNPFRNIGIRRALKHADIKITVSRALKEVLEQNGVMIDAVIHNGIDGEKITIDPRRIEELKREWEIGDRRCIFLGGRIRPDKGIKESFEALRLLLPSVPNALLLIAGARDRVEVLLREYPLAEKIRNHVIFTGWLSRNDVLAALSFSEVSVTPSVCFDSFPTTNLEAMAMGVPVVGTKFGGTPEIVENGVTGIIIDPRNTEAYAEALRSLLIDRSKAERMGEMGKKRVIENFSLKKQIDEYLKLMM